MISRQRIALNVLQRYGISKSAALQLLALSGDPSSPDYKAHRAQQNVVEALQSHDLRDPATPGFPGAATNPLGMQVGGPTE